MMDEKALNWRGTSLNDVKAFPWMLKSKRVLNLTKSNMDKARLISNR